MSFTIRRNDIDSISGFVRILHDRWVTIRNGTHAILGTASAVKQAGLIQGPYIYIYIYIYRRPYTVVIC